MKKIKHSTEKLNKNLSHFVGFHDICPWNENEDLVLLHQTIKDDIKHRTSSDFIDIGFWDFKNNSYEIIDSTNCWNWQQGARLQWFAASKFFYNCSLNNKLVSKIYDIKTQSFEVLEYPVYSINKDKNIGLTYNFKRLSKYWSGYGYTGGNFLDLNNVDDPLPSNDGVFMIDFKTNTVELIISFEDIYNSTSNNVSKSVPRFVTHTTFNSSGTKFAFFERFHTNEGALFSRFFVYDIEKKNLSFVGEGKFSHFDWYNDDEIMIWSRSPKSIMNKMNKKGLFNIPLFKETIRLIRKLKPSLKSKITNEYYRLYDVSNEPKCIGNIGKGIITSDGHPMFDKNNNNVFVNDTYPDLNNEQTLMLFDINKNERTDLGRFHVPKKFLDLDLKCDLHPRFSPSSKFVCVDSAHTGKRQVYIIEI